MSLLADLDIVADRTSRAAKIIRLAERPSVEVNPDDDDIKFTLREEDKNSIRSRSDPLLREANQAWNRVKSVVTGI